MDDPSLVLKSDFNRDPNEEFPDSFVHRFILDTLNDRIKTYGNKEILVDVNRKMSLTAGDFIINSRKIASGFLKRGVQRGHVILFYANNNVNYFVTLIASWICGAILSSTYHFYQEEYIEGLVNQVRPAFIVCDEETVAVAVTVQKNTKVPKEVFIFGEYENCVSIDSLLMDEEIFEPDEVTYNPDEPAFMPYSSGTTGLPKGVLLTHRNIYSNLLLLRIKTFNSRRVLFPGRIYHMSALCAILRNFLLYSTTYIFSNFTEEIFLDTLLTIKPEVLCLFFTHMKILLNDERFQNCDLSCVKIVITGGTSIHQEVRHRLRNRLPSLETLFIVYGITEFGYATAVQFKEFESGIGNRDCLNNLKSNTIGRLLPMVEMKVIDEMTGQALGPNKKGEICLKGPGMFHSYWNNPEATTASKINGWLHTGDIGFYDECGDIFYVQRKKEMIKTMGTNVYPAVIEEKLLKHECVADASVAGNYDPLLMDEVVKAYVVKKMGYENIREKELLEYINSKIHDHERLRGGITFVKEIPRNSSGKVMKNLLQELEKKESGI